MRLLSIAQSASAISRGINGQAPHVTRYLARVDERLGELPNADARRYFLADEIEKWNARFMRFQDDVRAKRDTGDVMAFDYVETVAALDKRMEAVK